MLRAFARILPREFRERVFEPALADFLLDEARGNRGWAPRLLGLVAFVGECSRLGIPQIVWREGRPTRFGTSLVAAVLVAALLIQRINYGR
jgi:hypothetical protein